MDYDDLAVDFDDETREYIDDDCEITGVITEITSENKPSGKIIKLWVKEVGSNRYLTPRFYFSFALDGGGKQNREINFGQLSKISQKLCGIRLGDNPDKQVEILKTGNFPELVGIKAVWKQTVKEKEGSEYKDFYYRVTKVFGKERQNPDVNF
jgi:hypothetical protein